MPNLQDFLHMELPVINNKPSPLPKSADITLPRNQWYFHKHESANNMDEPIQHSESTDGSNGWDIAGKGMLSWRNILVCLIVMDVIWFIHRMANTYATSKMILYGAPTFVDCKHAGNMRVLDFFIFGIIKMNMVSIQTNHLLN